MKKSLLWGAAVCMLILVGCSQSDSTPVPKGKKLIVTDIPSTVTIKNVVLKDDEGETVAGGLNDDGTFTLTVDGETWDGTGSYYITLVDQTAKEYTYTNGVSFTHGIKPAVKYNFNEPSSAIEWDKFKAPESFTLTVTGIPGDKVLIGASLMEITAPTTPVAVGMDMTQSGIYTFYYTSTDGGLPIDLTRPFYKPGTYLLALAEVDMQTFQETAVYMYKENSGLILFPVSDSLAFEDFEQMAMPIPQ